MPTLDRPAARRTVILVSGLVGVFLGVFLGAAAWESLTGGPLGGLISAVLPLTLTVPVAVGLFAWRAQVEARRTEALRRALQEAEKRLEHSLELRDLWEVTNKRLDLYHRIATRHAKMSFYSAQVAMGAGFALLLGFVLLVAFRASTTTASIVTGVLGAASAAFAGYIGRTFVRSQESSAAHLRAYFDQPLELFRYLAAERLLEGMDPAQRASVVADVARTIVAPAAPAPPTGGVTAPPLPDGTTPAPTAGPKPQAGRPADPPAST